MTEQVFTIGQKVICRNNSSGYGYLLTEGKEYTVTGYSNPESTEIGFTYPAYVTVTGDEGNPTTCHTYRFKPAE